MSEFVDRRMEGMTMALQQLRRVGLLSDEELKSEIIKIRDFEIKLQSVKTPEMYGQYIKHFKELLKTIKSRRQQLGLGQKKNDIEHTIEKRTNNLFEEAQERCPTMVNLWMDQAQFCTEIGLKTDASKVINSMIQSHPKNLDVWMFASKWEEEVTNELGNAINYLMRSIHFFPKNELIYTEIIRLVLTSIEKEMSKGTDVKQTSTDIMKNVYRVSVRNIPQLRFMLSLLKIADQYSCSEYLQELIINDLKEKFKDEAEMWHCLAQRELGAIDTPAIPVRRQNSCIRVYRDGIESIQTTEMWSFYLNTLITLNEKMGTTATQKNLLAAFEECHKANKMSEKEYMLWINLLTKLNSDKIHGLLVEVTTNMPHSVELWMARLRYHITYDQEDKVHEVYNSAVGILDEMAAIPIHHTLIQYYLLKGLDDKVEEIYLKSPHLYPDYLQWVCLDRGIKKAREAYHKIADIPPFSLKLHKTMLRLESMMHKPDPNEYRKVHETICSKIGQENVDIWIDHIKFELHHGDKSMVPNIYKKALSTLSQTDVETFKTMYSILMG